MTRADLSRFALTALLAAAALAPAQAKETFTTLKENIFVCISPQAYEDAMVRVRATKGGDLEPLKKELAEAKQCMLVDAELADSIMAPSPSSCSATAPRCRCSSSSASASASRCCTG